MIGALCAAMLAAAAAGCTSSPASTAPSGARAGGGTAVLAEPPSTTPNYIWPYTPSADFSAINTDGLQYLLYRPLYWFGLTGQPLVNCSLSVADPPMFNGDKVTITLKHYMWSNGTQVTARDVMFWLNLELAEPANFGGCTGFPTNVKDITVVSRTENTLVMDKGYSPTWFLYNELSQITPMPVAWDRTASGPSSCATRVSDCTAVFSYLNSQ